MPTLGYLLMQQRKRLLAQKPLSDSQKRARRRSKCAQVHELLGYYIIDVAARHDWEEKVHVHMDGGAAMARFLERCDPAPA